MESGSNWLGRDGSSLSGSWMGELGVGQVFPDASRPDASAVVQESCSATCSPWMPRSLQGATYAVMPVGRNGAVACRIAARTKAKDDIFNR